MKIPRLVTLRISETRICQEFFRHCNVTQVFQLHSGYDPISHNDFFSSEIFKNNALNKQTEFLQFCQKIGRWGNYIFQKDLLPSLVDCKHGPNSLVPWCLCPCIALLNTWWNQFLHSWKGVCFYG